MNRFTAAIQTILFGVEEPQVKTIEKKVVEYKDRYFVGEATFTDLYRANLATGKVVKYPDASAYGGQVEEYEMAEVETKYFLTCHAAHTAAEKQPFPKLTRTRYTNTLTTPDTTVRKVKALKIEEGYLIVPDGGYNLVVIEEDKKGNCCTP